MVRQIVDFGKTHLPFPLRPPESIYNHGDTYINISALSIVAVNNTDVVALYTADKENIGGSAWIEIDVSFKLELKAFHLRTLPSFFVLRISIFRV